MKKALLLLLLAGTIGHANSAKADAPCMNQPLLCYASTSVPALWPLSTTGVSSYGWKVQAAQVVNDSQDYFQTGKLSVFLSEKIKNVQAVNEQNNISEQDALDILIYASVETLK